MSLCLFEDIQQPSLLPLTHVNPDFDLRCGAFTARERAGRLFPDVVPTLCVRAYLTEVMRERSGCTVNAPGDAVLFLSGRALLDRVHAAVLAECTDDRVFVSNDAIVAVSAQTPALRAALADAVLHGGDLHAVCREVPRAPVDVPMVLRPWDLVAYNRRMLLHDAEFFPVGTIADDAHVSPHAILVDPMDIAVGSDAVISAGAILDPVEGPIVVDAGAEIMHGAIVRGPVYIGAGSRIKAGAKIYEGTSIGPVCKVGGEVEDTIFHSYANKQHEGFVGHSYLAAWTNLGADTNTSDLKNNYSVIRVTLEGEEVDTGRMFLGSIMADHTKTGINTMLNTGTCTGVGCNIFGGDFPPKHLPSFVWGGAASLTAYDFARFVRVAETVMQRRGLTLTAAEHSVLKTVYDATADLRSSIFQSQPSGRI